MSSNVHRRPGAAARVPSWLRHRGLLILCGTGGLAVLILVLSVFGDRGIFKIRQLSRDQKVLEQKVQEIERDNEALRRQLGAMREGRGSVELAAREKLGLVKPGEVVYDFRPDPLEQRR